MNQTGHQRWHMFIIFCIPLHMCFICAKRKVVGDNEWTGWLRWLRTCFEEGKITEYWKSDLELEKWFDPAFEGFINKEIIPTIKVNES